MRFEDRCLLEVYVDYISLSTFSYVNGRGDL